MLCWLVHAFEKETGRCRSAKALSKGANRQPGWDTGDVLASFVTSQRVESKSEERVDSFSFLTKGKAPLGLCESGITQGPFKKKTKKNPPRETLMIPLMTLPPSGKLMHDAVSPRLLWSQWTC